MNDQSNELVSIIIPVYNTYEYLNRCVSSALKQTHQNLQIILINDGSTDASGMICESYAAADPRVEVIHQENAGQSAARNAGLDRVKGRWIAFLDSDDYISKYFIESNLAACLKFGADISISKFIVDYKGNISEDGFKNTGHAEQISNRDAMFHHLGKKGSLFNIVCSKLFSVSLWKELRFPVGLIWEDLFVSHHFIYSAQIIVMNDAYLYAYYMAPGSTMRKPFSLKRLDVLDAWKEGIRFYEQASEPDFADIAQRILCNRLFDAYGLCKKMLPDEREVHEKLRGQAIETYGKVKRIRSYIDISRKKAFAYRVKQIIGRYFPLLYTTLFLRKEKYNI